MSVAEAPWYWRIECGNGDPVCDQTCADECAFSITITGGTGVDGTYVMIPRGSCFWSNNPDANTATIKRSGDDKWVMSIGKGVETTQCQVQFQASGNDCPPDTTGAWTLLSNECGGTPVLASIVKDCSYVDPDPGCIFFEKAGGGDEGYSKSLDLSSGFIGSVTAAFFDVVLETYGIPDRMKIYATGQDYTDPSVTPAIYDSGCVSTFGPSQTQVLVTTAQNPVRVVIESNCAGGHGTAWYWRIACAQALPDCCDCDVDVTVGGCVELPSTFHLKSRGACFYSTDYDVGVRQPKAIISVVGGKWTLTVSNGNGSILWQGPDVTSVANCFPTDPDDWTLIYQTICVGFAPSLTIALGDCVHNPGPCGVGAKAGGSTSKTTQVNVSAAFASVSTVAFEFKYNTYSTKSRVRILSSTNVTLFDSGCVSTNGEVTQTITVTQSQGPLSIKIDAGCNGDPNNLWYWQLGCSTSSAQPKCYWTWNAVYDCEAGWGSPTLVSSQCLSTPPSDLNAWVKTATGSASCTYTYTGAAGPCVGACSSTTPIYVCGYEDTQCDTTYPATGTTYATNMLTKGTGCTWSSGGAPIAGSTKLSSISSISFYDWQLTRDEGTGEYRLTLAAYDVSGSSRHVVAVYNHYGNVDGTYYRVSSCDTSPGTLTVSSTTCNVAPTTCPSGTPDCLALTGFEDVYCSTADAVTSDAVFYGRMQKSAACVWSPKLVTTGTASFNGKKLDAAGTSITFDTTNPSDPHWVLTIAFLSGGVTQSAWVGRSSNSAPTGTYTRVSGCSTGPAIIRATAANCYTTCDIHGDCQFDGNSTMRLQWTSTGSANACCSANATGNRLLPYVGNGVYTLTERTCATGCPEGSYIKYQVTHDQTSGKWSVMIANYCGTAMTVLHRTPGVSGTVMGSCDGAAATAVLDAGTCNPGGNLSVTLTRANNNCAVPTCDFSSLPASVCAEITGLTGPCATYNGARTFRKIVNSNNYRSDDNAFTLHCDSGYWIIEGPSCTSVICTINGGIVVPIKITLRRLGSIVGDYKAHSPVPTGASCAGDPTIEFINSSAAVISGVCS